MQAEGSGNQPDDGYEGRPPLLQPVGKEQETPRLAPPRPPASSCAEESVYVLLELPEGVPLPEPGTKLRLEVRRNEQGVASEERAAPGAAS